MRGKKRTKEEKYELFKTLDRFLAMGFSLKRACSLADLPYSTIRDMAALYEPLRATTTALQNSVNVTARANVIRSIEEGSITDSKWWLEKFDYTEPQESPLFGGVKEARKTYIETEVEWEMGARSAGIDRAEEWRRINGHIT